MPITTSARLARVAEEAAKCTRCPLYRNATLAVFGEGPANAKIMMVGEQPGDQEDLQGRPFVGPAGRMLDRALAEVGLDRRSVYLTNAVKHFKNEPRGKKRLHRRPDRSEIEACKVWLDQEISLVRPDLVVALGVTAAVALSGRPVVISRERGRKTAFAGGQRGMVTAHPSSILRMPDETSRRRAYAAFVKDLEQALKLAQAA